MQNFKIFVCFSAFTLLLAFGCKKDNQVTNHSTSSLQESTNDRGDGEAAAVQARVDEIVAFRESVHKWRDNPRGEGMSASDAIEKTEIAFNLFMGQPTKAFESYEWIEEDITVSASLNWSPDVVATFFDAVKTLVSEKLSGENREVYIISLDNPTNKDGKSLVRVNLHVGVNPLANVEPYAFTEGTRWAKSPNGFTDPTPCEGAANTDIGAAANQQIAVYNAINAGPGSGGNTALPGKVVSKIVYGDHSLLGFGFPQGTNYPKVYNIATWGIPNLQPLHYNDFGINSAPDLNCLSNPQLLGFGFGNIGLANNGQQFVPPVSFGQFFTPRRVVCTGVGAFAGFAQTPGITPIDVQFQDHPTRHYFGVVFTVAFPPVDEM